MLLDYKSLHDGLNQAEINALYSILRKETIFTETLLMGTTGKYGVYNIVDTGIQVINAIPTGEYTFNFSDGTVGVGVANDEGIVDVDISFDRSSVCDVVITFPPYVVRINYNLSLSGDKSIIQKNESVVVTALLTMDGSACSGESLNYSVKHGSTVLDSGSVTTDSSGQATISYTGTGVGDVTFTVEYGTLLQETYEIEDCYFFDDASIDNTSKYTKSSGATLSFEDNHYTTILEDNSNSEWIRFIDNLNVSDYKFEYDVKFDGTHISYTFPKPNTQSGFEVNESITCNLSPIDSILSFGSQKSVIIDYDTWYHVEIIKTDNTATLTIYNNNVAVDSITRTDTSNLQYLKYHFIWERSAKTFLKNIKLKSLTEQTALDNLTLSSTTPIIQTGDSAIVTASVTHNGVAVNGRTLDYTVKHGSTTIDTGTVTTGSDGKASISYTGTGIGDVTFEVTYGTLLQETYEIKDTKFYDASSSGNVSNYATTTDVTFSYDSTNSAYLLSHSNTSSLTSIQLKNHTFSNIVTVEADIKLSSTATNVQCGIGLLNGNTSVNAKTTFYSPDSYYAVSLIESTKTSYGSNEVVSTDTHLNIQKEVWYRAKVVYNGSNVIFTLYNGDTVIGSVSATKSVLSTTSNELAIWLGFNNAKAYIKNIMVY